MSVYLKAPHEREEELKRLYQACFEEKDEAVRILFEEYALTDTCYAVLCGGEIAAALYLLPAQAAENGRAVQAHYLFAAGTLPKYRGRGLMNGLIGYALADAAARGDRYSALLPAGRGFTSFMRGLDTAPFTGQNVRRQHSSGCFACHRPHARS